MPCIQVESVQAAGVNNNNMFQGSAFEYARGRCAVSLGVVASATGGFISINSGADVILEESPPYILAAFPIIPDHMFYNDVMEPMDRLRVSARNPTGGSLTFRAIAQVTPL